MSVSKATPKDPPPGPGPSEEPGTRQLETIIDELQKRLRTEGTRHGDELRQFAYAVSHDLREPLRMVASYAQLLDQRYTSQLDNDGREFIGIIMEAARRMEKLLADLLNYSHQFHPLEEPPTLVDAEAALASALLMMDARIRESAAQITHDPLPKITFDFQRLTQLFRQLISNSMKFRSAEPPRIHISAAAADDEVTFSVCDNGLGIDPRYHEQIFGVFRRLHGREHPGTGIGLAICKRIVEQEGGRIWVESESGKGATFRFNLPR